MITKKYDVCKPIKYIVGNNEEKTFWANVGSMTEFIKDDGSTNRIIEIYAIGLKASVFPKKPKTDAGEGSGVETTETTHTPDKPSATSKTATSEGVDYPPQEEKIDEIPF